MNEFNSIAEKYAKTNLKPDKLHSMLPTLVSMLDLTGKETVIDVGCGDGFFTLPISKKAKRVIGVDQSIKQIERAPIIKNVEYKLVDLFEFRYPKSDRISCPFVLNYLRSSLELTTLFNIFYKSLRKGGKIASIVDMPISTIHNNLEYGAIKSVEGDFLIEGATIKIELYDDHRNRIVTLLSYYHERITFERCLLEAGFKKVEWKSPLVSDEGVKIFGRKFWDRYKQNCDISYLLAEK